MVTVLTKTRRVGGSVMVTLPKDAVETLGVEEGEIVEITIRLPRKSYLGALRGIGTFSEKDRADHA